MKAIKYYYFVLEINNKLEKAKISFRKKPFMI